MAQIVHIPRCVMNRDPYPPTVVTTPFKALPFPQRPAPIPARPELPSEEEWERLAVQDGLYNAIRKYGAERVMRWVRNLAAIAGQEVS